MKARLGNQKSKVQKIVTGFEVFSAVSTSSLPLDNFLLVLLLPGGSLHPSGVLLVLSQALLHPVAIYPLKAVLYYDNQSETHHGAIGTLPLAISTIFD